MTPKPLEGADAEEQQIKNPHARCGFNDETQNHTVYIPLFLHQ